jgi:DNA-directed RNA polymerase subunit alpha
MEGRMIHKNWAELIKPTQLDVKPGNDPLRQAVLTAEPLERGFGLTLGNALRRVLLSSLQGAAITAVQIDNVLHEFSSVAGVREDVTDIVLNAIRMEVEGPKRLSVNAKGPGVVTAGDISDSAGIEILNKEHVICHLDEGADLFMELTVNQGKGYVAADKNKPEDAPIGLIPIDAIYSPISKVSYDVQPTREGQVLDYDNLTMKIETDGSITPDDAVAYAARILQDQLSIFVNFDEPEAAGRQDEDCISAWTSKIGRPTISRIWPRNSKTRFKTRVGYTHPTGHLVGWINARTAGEYMGQCPKESG